MASITMANTLRGGQRAKDSQGSDKHLSKCVELNGKYRLFFRTRPASDDPGLIDVWACTVPGRPADLEVCHTTFIPYNDSMVNIGEDGSVTDITSLTSWSRISKVLYEARCTREKTNAEEEQKRTAAQMGKDIDILALNKAINAIEERYHGGESASGQKIYPTESLILGNMQLKLTTRLLVVKLLPDGTPDFTNAQYAVLELSNGKVQELLKILNDKNYNNTGKNYIEVGYDYTGASKQAAGQNASFQGIADTLLTEVQYASLWESKGKSMVENIIPDDSNLFSIQDLEEREKAERRISDYIKGRNRNLKGGTTIKDIESSITKYVSSNEALFVSINWEDDSTRYAASDFLKYNLADSVPKIKQQFEAIVSDNADNAESTSGKLEEASQAPDTSTAASATTTAAPTVPAGPTLQEMENNALAAISAAESMTSVRDVVEKVGEVDLGGSPDDLGDI